MYIFLTFMAVYMLSTSMIMVQIPPRLATSC